MPSIRQIDYPDHARFFEALTETLKILPNIRSLEIRSNITETNSRIPTFWKRYDPNIRSFFEQNPELETLSWQKWFQVKRPVRYGAKRLRFDQAYMGVIESAAAAHCQIFEIKINATTIMLGEDSFIDENVRSLFQRPNLGFYIDLYKSTFASLTRLEIPIVIWGSFGIRFWKAEQIPPSALFLTLLRNTEELAVTRLNTRYTLDRDWEVHPDLRVSSDIVLPRLRILEVRELGLLEEFIDFLKANRTTLRKLVCRSTFNQRVLRVDMIQILSAIHFDLDLDYYHIDFLTNKILGKMCYLCVEVKKKFSETGVGDERYIYRVGTKCESRSRHGFLTEELEPTKTNVQKWKEKETWEAFVAEIRSIRTVGICKEHWDGDMKPATGLLG
ncbi:hypothetical protein TWF481_002546 [Arthrobotrys musiformis]